MGRVRYKKMPLPAPSERFITYARYGFNKAGEFVSLPTKGGPTEDDPDRPYCKSDQSCCDFCCGN